MFFTCTSLCKHLHATFYDNIAAVANKFSHLTQNYTDALLASFRFIHAMADTVDLTSTPSQKEFMSFYEFLPDYVKDWYSPSDNKWLLTMLQEQLHKWQQDEDSLPLVTNAQLQDLEDPLVDPKPAVKRTRYARPFTDEEVKCQKKNAIPENTRQDTNYCMRLFNHWRESRTETTGVSIPMLSEMDCSQLSRWVQRFILEARKKDGTEFQSTTLHHIVAGLMRHLRLNGKPEIDFFKDSSLQNL